MHTATPQRATMTASRAERDAEFSAWMTARQPALHRTAYLLAGDHHTAEDLVSATLAKVYLAWHRIERRDSVDGYARRVLVNEHNSLWRRPWKKREVTRDELPEQFGVHDHYDEGQRGELWSLVQQLPRKQRAVIVLRYYEELTETEIADALGVSPGTVKSQASRAMATLRTHAAQSGIVPTTSGEEEK
ncbi:SigE family RNA polymerase sigma factor [Nocardioides alcanivorans]|uniref:SigE family RNA polymerase sigma factor n=1 Tax=Nocardioides alcanivorans TaxID=2897352 RepID=UPI001F17AECF|nr:SigE family RNA polymerase sigma factor [Nocardioides alcanivorans]